MCIKCPTIAPRHEELIIARCSLYMGMSKASLQRILDNAILLEDMYRIAGIHYHSSQLSSRRPPEIAQKHLDHLQRLFETSRVEEYNAIFKELDEIVHAAAELSSRHCPDRVTSKQLVHHVFCVLKPSVAPLQARFEAFFDELDEYLARAYILFDISRMNYESDAEGGRVAWQDISGPDSDPVPARKGEEWAKYRAWIWSLPETQRAVQIGRTVDDVALEMLYHELDGFHGESESQQFSQPPSSTYSWSDLASEFDAILVDQ
jgi:hypothetical protein